MKHFLLLFFCVLLSFACTKDEGESPAQSDEPTEKELKQRDTESDPRKIAMERTDREGEQDSAAAEEEAAADPSGRVTRQDLRGTVFFLHTRQKRIVEPVHQVIGELAPLMTAGEGEGKIYSMITDFLESFKDGVIKEKLFEKGSSDNVIRILKGAAESGYRPERWFIGKLQDLGGGEGGIPLLLKKDGAEAAGAVYVVKSGDTWYISDIQVDFSILGDEQ